MGILITSDEAPGHQIGVHVGIILCHQLLIVDSLFTFKFFKVDINDEWK